MQAQYRNHPGTVSGGQRSPHAPSPVGRRGGGPVTQVGTAAQGLPANYAQNLAAQQKHHQQLQQQQQQQQQLLQLQLEAQKRENLRRASRKPTDRNLPDGIDEIIIGNGAKSYQALREMERRLDAVVVRKRLEITDADINMGFVKNQILRIWISNTAENQAWQLSGTGAEGVDFDSMSAPSYRVRIEGKLLDENIFGDIKPDNEVKTDEATENSRSVSQDNIDKGGDACIDESSGCKAPSKKIYSNDKISNKDSRSTEKLPFATPNRFSNFFRQITIDFDKPKTSGAVPGDGQNSINWKRNDSMEGQTTSEFDYLEFQRRGDENLNITISLHRDEKLRERFQLSPALERLLDTRVDDRLSVLMGLWHYIKSHNLQEEEESRRVHCDDGLKSVFNQDVIFFPHLPDMIHTHLSPLPPVKLNYTIRVDAEYIQDSSTQGKYTIYDIPVIVIPQYAQACQAALLNSLSTLQPLSQMDDALAATVRAISDSKMKWSFFEGMLRDPVRFTTRWILSQQHDLEVFLCETGGWGDEGQGDEWRRSRGYPSQHSIAAAETAADLCLSTTSNGRYTFDSVWSSQAAREAVALWLARRGNP